MKTRYGVGAFGLVVGSVVAAACSSDPAGGSSSGDTDSGSDVKPDITPPGCDPTKDPKDNLECVVNSFGVFIDSAGGNDQNDGSKEKPVKTFKTALSKLGNKSRLYVCAGTYDERVELTSAISIYGGFACGAWTYAASNKVSIAPKEPGIALTLKNAGRDPLRLQDISVVAANAKAPGESSVAVSLDGSSDAVFARCSFEAGEAADGETKPVAQFTWDASNAPIGGQAPLVATPLVGGLGGKLTCPGGAITQGGSGGNLKAAEYNGQPGTPSGGPGGPGGTTCSLGTDGAQPAAAADGALLDALGRIEGGLWVSSGPNPGKTGAPGGGGGGGGAKDGEGGGGGGGSGGCGGAGGGGGQSGGSSIALLVSASAVTLLDTKLEAKAGRKGGPGVPGQDGDTRFGARSAVATGACDGGRGGRGGKGGAGAGGAGGLSAAVVHRGAAPKFEGTTAASARVGARGEGGGGGAGNDGPPGQSAPVIAAQPDGTVKPGT